MTEAGDQRTFRSIAAVFIMMGLCKVFGLLRDVLIAKYFGASANTDAYMAAHLVPVQLASALGTALALSLIPVYLSLPKDDRRSLVDSLFNRTALVLLLLSTLGVLFPGAAIKVLAPGFDAATSQIAGRFFRLIAMVFAFISLSGMLGGVMNARRRFALPAAGPGILNLSIIAAVLLLSRKMGINSVALGILIGGLAQLAIYGLYLRLIGHRHDFRVLRPHPASRQVFKLFGPIFVGLALGQLSLLVNNALASTLDEGSITVMGYAFKMLTLVIGLFLPISTVLFPELSRSVAAQDDAATQRHVNRGLRLIVFLALPSTVALIVLGQPIVNVLFRHGEFDADAARATAWALYAFAPGLIGIVASEFLARAFYSLKDARTPMLISASTLALNIVLNLILIKVLPAPYRYLGLAAGTSASILVNVSVMMLVLRARISGLSFRPFILGAAVTLVLALTMGACCWATFRLVGSRTYEVVALGASIVVGIGSYAALTLGTRRTEALKILAQLRLLAQRRR
ncbi:MAG: murein biosynthesis integral membrane protein MurJ [Candidatus Alcyoniella australis]|nr:murein biosynthesis integral membrane protein MurJ [Candidatus Alcyoniella australis]